VRDHPGIEIKAVVPGSLAQRLGLKAGDRLAKINAQELADEFDYRFAQSEERVRLEWVDGQGHVRHASARKHPDQDLGLDFADTPFRTCRVKCVFCFIDQNPKGMRPSIYFKDEDYRFSWLYGNYVTLFNMSEADFAKAIERRMSPMYVSVHSTDELLRSRILGIRKPTRILGRLQALAQAGLEIHAQIVVAPGLNDEKALGRTLQDLAGLHPQVASIAVVPVGLTRHRKGLTPLRMASPLEAAQTLDRVRAFQAQCLARLGTRLAFAADEWYLRAKRPLPLDEEYEGYPQLGNGVGLIRSFEGDVDKRLKRPLKQGPMRRGLLVTGLSFAPALRKICGRIMASSPGLELKVLPVANRFYGPSVTVAGLLTGKDISLAVSRALERFPADRVIVPDVMLRDRKGIFLDDHSPSALQQALGVPVKIVSADVAGLMKALR
jgi:putative radical SAM enzyme (TIGR03279 family)